MYQIHPHSGVWPELDLAEILGAMADRLGLSDNQLITLVWADDAFVRTLNHDHRGKDRPTNVLSYASDLEGELGDLIFALETIAQEARDQDKAFTDHLIHLILHGSLHLLGYDHESKEEAETMEALETQILHELGLPDPYGQEDLRPKPRLTS